MPSRLRYVVAVAALVLGCAAAITFMYPRLASLTEGFVRVVVPGDHEIDLAAAGSYTIFHEPSGTVDGVLYTAENISGLRVTLTGAEGEDIPLSAGAGSRYTVGGHRGFSIYSFEIAEPGPYRLSGAYEDGRTTPPTILAISSGFVKDLVFTILGTIAIVFAGVGVALWLGLTTFFRRRRFQADALRSDKIPLIRPRNGWFDRPRGRHVRGQEDITMAFAAETSIESPTPVRATAGDDYSVVRQVIEYLTENWREQPSLEAIAADDRHGADAAAEAVHALGRAFPRKRSCRR